MVLENLELPVKRPLVWVGSSQKDLMEFPKDVRRLIGSKLQLIQYGGMPKDVKKFYGVGSGVFEIAIEYATNAYRVVVAVKLGNTIYVLHAFQKTSPRGRETPKKHVDLIKKRYGSAQSRSEG